VGLNFNQEAVEADMRYGLVRVRENAESIAFYGGQNNEMAALMEVCVGGGTRTPATVLVVSRLVVPNMHPAG
jgi:hypothetical protein